MNDSNAFDLEQKKTNSDSNVQGTNLSKSQEDFNDLANQKVKELLESLAQCRGEALEISDVDWEVVYSVKEEIFDGLRALGVDI